MLFLHISPMSRTLMLTPLCPCFDRLSGTITTRQLMRDPWVWPTDPKTHCYSPFTLCKLTNVFMRPFNWPPTCLGHGWCILLLFLLFLSKQNTGVGAPVRTRCNRRRWKELICILPVFLDIRRASRCKYESDSSHNGRIETHYEISESDQWGETRRELLWIPITETDREQGAF